MSRAVLDMSARLPVVCPFARVGLALLWPGLSTGRSRHWERPSGPRHQGGHVEPREPCLSSIRGRLHFSVWNGSEEKIDTGTDAGEDVRKERAAAATAVLLVRAVVQGKRHAAYDGPQTAVVELSKASTYSSSKNLKTQTHRPASSPATLNPPTTRSCYSQA